MLASVKPLLKKDGILLISTPNFDNIFTRFTQVKPPEHIFYFTRATLTRLLEQLGFKVFLVKNTSITRSLKTLSSSTSFSKGLPRLILNFIMMLKLNTLAEKVIMPRIRIHLLVFARRFK